MKKLEQPNIAEVAQALKDLGITYKYQKQDQLWSRGYFYIRMDHEDLFLAYAATVGWTLRRTDSSSLLYKGYRIYE